MRRAVDGDVEFCHFRASLFTHTSGRSRDTNRRRRRFARDVTRPRDETRGRDAVDARAVGGEASASASRATREARGARGEGRGETRRCARRRDGRFMTLWVLGTRGRMLQV